jgi:hypothetical protein
MVITVMKITDPRTIVCTCKQCSVAEFMVLSCLGH